MSDTATLAPTYPRPSSTPELDPCFEFEILAWTPWNPSRFTVFTRDPIRPYSRTAMSPGTPSVLEGCRLCRWRTGEAGGSIGAVGQTVGQNRLLRATAGPARVLRSLGTRVTLGPLRGTIGCSQHHFSSEIYSHPTVSQHNFTCCPGRR